MDQSTNHHLFVYGTLRSGFKSPAYEYISQYFRFEADGKVRGKLYDLGEYPAAMPTDTDHFIVGELYTIKEPSEFSWAIGQLDDYEGVHAEPGESQLYRRELAEIYLPSGKTQAWIYWYNGDVAGKPFLESGDVMDYHN